VCNDSGPAGPGTLPSPGFTLTLQPQWIAGSQLNVANAITLGAPVRGFDKVMYRVYQAADGNWYLGQRNPAATGTIQPVVGALAIAIVALVIVGALIAGAFFSGTQEQRVAENVRRVQASFGVAEEGVYDIIRTWDSIGVGGVQNKTKYAGLYPYPAYPASKDTAKYGWETAKSRTGSYSGSVMKLNDELYLIDMSARDTMSLAGRIRGGHVDQVELV